MVVMLIGLLLYIVGTIYRDDLGLFWIVYMSTAGAWVISGKCVVTAVVPFPVENLPLGNSD